MSSMAKRSCSPRFVTQLLLLLGTCNINHAFIVNDPRLCSPRARLEAFPSKDSRNGKSRSSAAASSAKKEMTLAELRDEMLKNPTKFQKNAAASASKTKQASKRTRRRVENPKQTYLYKAQRIALEKAGKLEPKKKISDDAEDGELEEQEDPIDNSHNPLVQAKEFGLVPAMQHCDPSIGQHEPKIVGEIRVSEETGSGALAYVIEKPAGWSILGGGGGGSNANTNKQDEKSDESTRTGGGGRTKRHKYARKVTVEDEDGSIDVLEYNELDIMSLLTAEELEEYMYNADSDSSPFDEVRVVSSAGDVPDELFSVDIEKGGGTPQTARLSNEDLDESHEESEDSSGKTNSNDVNSRTAFNLSRIAARAAINSDKACFAPTKRPSLVAWLKETKANEGIQIRGGNFWTAVAGASSVDDSGLVVLCPKSNVDSLFIDYATYLAVVGNGGFMAPKTKGKNEDQPALDEASIEVFSRLKKGRGDDAILSVQVTVPEVKCTASAVVQLCQNEFQDGIRGDPAANPFDRRAARRLIHCDAMSVSSLLFDENVKIETSSFPDDIAVLAERGNYDEYESGSFVGRFFLRGNELTTTYREINGAADGYPGWTVDRYDKWLFVQHDINMPKGPLPSIHDGNTAGIYYLENDPDRSTMGSGGEIRPRLLEGQPAPESFPVMENGVKYLVSLEKDLSTGIFLDQRPQRAWLKHHCCADTHVLNCFAHTGAFSVAAACAGASTVSIDLSRKWLDRLPAHLEANGIPFDERHDCIYGDVFDWLARLAKRGEKYDIVILDPPSASVGGRKKKRWSIRNDMDELVSLAAGMVKPGGLLWTTTNSASIHPVKFARLCKKGLDNAGYDAAKLERIQPMPSDFPCTGPQAVKNLVWRLP